MRSTVDGDDVLQETLLKAIRARAANPPIDNIEGWIFRIAHNTSIDFLRERQRKSVEPLPDDIGASPLPESEIVM